MKKQLLKSTLTLIFTFSSAHAFELTEKYCNKHKRTFEKEINHKINKGLYSHARGNMLKLTSHARCLELVESGAAISDFKKIFKNISKEYCSDLNKVLEEILAFDIYSEDEDLSEVTIELLEDVESICTEFVDQKASILEFEVELYNSLGLEV